MLYDVALFVASHDRLMEVPSASVVTSAGGSNSLEILITMSNERLWLPLVAFTLRVAL